MIFEVLDDASNVLVSEPFTIVITDCTDANAASLSFDTMGPIIDTDSTEDLFYDWNVSGYPIY